MVCIYCKERTQVTNSRPQKRNGTTWRRRECLVCGGIFSTIELPDLESAIRFTNPSGQLLPFQRDKLFVSILKALGHRQDATSDATALTATIIAKALKKASGAVLSRSGIIQIAAETLDKFDSAAATQYRAYHPL